MIKEDREWTWNRDVDILDKVMKVAMIAKA